MPFDLASPTLAQASEQGHTFDLMLPDGTPADVTITVRGPEAEAVRAVLKRQLAQQQSRNLMARRRGKDPDPITLEEAESDSIDLAVAHTLAWTGITENGAAVPCTPENARRLYKAQAWIRRDVIDTAAQLGNFVRPTSSNSSTTPAPSSPST